MAYNYGETGETRRSDPAFPTTKQFISTVGKSIDDPALGLAKVKNKENLKKWEITKTEQDLKDKKHHLAASKLYVAVMKLYQQLDSKDQDEIKKWLSKNSKTINKYKEWRSLQKQTKIAKQANNLMQVELKYKSSIADLKEKNKNALDTSMRVKSYRPTEEILKLYKQKNHTLPIFEGAKPRLGPAKLDKNGVAWMPGLGDYTNPEWYPKEEINPFIKTLPGDKQENAQRDYETKIRELNNQTELTLERLPRLDMDMGTLQNAISSIDADQEKLQPQIIKLIDQINDTNVSTPLSILVEIKPERFQTSKSLLDALNLVLNHINTLGGDPSPTQQIDTLIKDQIVESKQVASAMDATAILLNKVDSVLQDKPTGAVETPITQNKTYLAMIAAILTLVALIAWRKK